MQNQSVIEKYKTVFKNNGILKVNGENLKEENSLRVSCCNKSDRMFYLCEQEKSTCTA
jgi:hypothetical protein